MSISNGENRRAGPQALRLLSSPVHVSILQSLSSGLRSLVDLRQEAGAPTATTLRNHMRALEAIGAVAKHRDADFPHALGYGLTPAGQDLLSVRDVTQAWLRESPDGPLTLGTSGAKTSIRALLDGWGTNIVRVLAAQPLSLTQLDSVIPGVSYPSLERRLSAMRICGQIEALPTRAKGTPYVVTEWLRRAVLPILAATSWEERHLGSEATPLGGLHVEAAFLLGVPLVRLGDGVSGSCRLVVGPASQDGRTVGVTARFDQGVVVSCSSRVDREVGAWVAAQLPGWFAAVLSRDPGRLETDGESRLAELLVRGLRRGPCAKTLDGASAIREDQFD